MRTRFYVRFFAEWGGGYDDRGFTLEIGTSISNYMYKVSIEGESKGMKGMAWIMGHDDEK